jgi:hypothetical protein
VTVLAAHYTLQGTPDRRDNLPREVDHLPRGRVDLAAPVEQWRAAPWAPLGLERSQHVEYGEYGRVCDGRVDGPLFLGLDATALVLLDEACVRDGLLSHTGSVERAGLRPVAEEHRQRCIRRSARSVSHYATPVGA